MEKRFRQDYDGEFVVTEVRLTDGQSTQQREWIPNPIQNYHISGRAAVIGSRVDEKRFRHQRLQRHRGGLLGKKRLQTYGTADTWTDMTLDFYVSTDIKQIRSIAKSQYDEKSTVYTSPRLCLENPGRFYIVPYLPVMDNLALNAYLAAFDGHEEIFMLGYNSDTQAGTANWISDVDRVIETYDTTRFYFVGLGTMPQSWLNHANAEQIEHRRFVSYCDI
jgi:hypothetical protein